MKFIVSVPHQNEGGIGISNPHAQEISRDPRDVLGAQPKGHLEGRGKSRGQKGGFLNNSRVLVEYSHSIHHQGVHGIILPCRQGRIDSVKSNLFIKMMIEWWMLSRWATTKGIPILSQAVGFLMSDFQPNQILMTPRISYLFCAAIFFCRRRYQHIIKLQSKGFCLWQRISNYLGKRWG